MGNFGSLFLSDGDNFPYRYQLHNNDQERPKRSSYSLLSQLTSWFSLSLLPKVKEKGRLEEQDLPSLEHEQRTSYLYELSQQNYENARRGDGSLSIISLLHRTVGPKFYLAGLWVLLAGLGRIGKTVLLTSLLFALEEGSDFSVCFVIFCSLVFLNFCQNLIFRRTIYRSRINQIRVQGLLSTVFYEKTLKLSPFSRKEYTKGTMFNLLSNDVETIGDTGFSVHNLCVSFIVLPVALAFMIHLISWPAAVGFIGTLVLVTAMNYWSSQKLTEQRNRINELKDKRSEKLTEIFQGIRVVKMFAWEKKFQENVHSVIEHENKAQKKVAFFTAMQELCFTMIPLLITLTSIVIHVSLGNKLTTAVAFGVYSTALQLSWFFYFAPAAISAILSAKLSIKRLETFLNLREQAHERYTREPEPILASEPVVHINNGSFTWTENKSTLNDINLTIGKGQLVAVVGEVGSGKSSLLSAIMGEMECIDGSAVVSSSIAYVPQQPFILNATLRDNVLFTKSFNKQLYDEALRVSCLDRDVSLLPSGDMTLIGEKGINLSGGQKARVNLARAVYNQGSLVLLDDPLSAVDAHVGSKIFHECIIDQLKDKTRVLVTHQIHFIKPEYNFDLILVMRDGKIAESGTFADLYKPGKEFYSLFRQSQSAIGKKTKSDVATEVSDPSLVLEHLEEEQTNEIKYTDVPEEATEEETQRLSWSIFKAYFSNLKSVPFFAALVLAFVFTQLSESAIGWWLSYGTEQTTGSEESLSVKSFMTVFVALCLARGVFEIIRNVVTSFACLRIATNVFDQTLERVLHAKPAFFDVTPIGRIIKRFQHDHGVLVRQVRYYLCESWLVAFLLIGNFIMLTYLFPMSFIVWGPRISQHISNYGETVDGLSVIRAYGFAGHFVRKNMRLTDCVSNSGLAAHDMSIWYSVCLTTLGRVLDCCIFRRWYRVVLDNSFAARYILLGLLKPNPNPRTLGQMGYALTLLLSLSMSFDWSFECLSNLELAIGAFCRLNYYVSQVPQEAYHPDAFAVVPDRMHLEANELGKSIVIKHLRLQYRPEDRPVLHDVSLVINKAEKIGICGRTGAGKSSIINALMRMAPITRGEVFVNDVPTSQMELTRLRSQIAIIPQDPVLFSGSIRSNLDPFSEYTDHELWLSLDKVCLKDVIATLPNQLDAEISENGSNFSVGQRQLICLARAVLRKIRQSSLILLMDEATANVDPKTDSLIQRTIKEEFESCTVLTIAHRINTIMHCNRILVMDKGCVVEYDAPQTLLANPQSHFAQLVRQSTSNLLATSAE